MNGLERAVHGDYRLPEATITRRVKVQCGCGIRSRPVHMTEGGIAWLMANLRQPPPPDLVIQSLWCKDCGELVKVTAKNLHLAA